MAQKYNPSTGQWEEEEDDGTLSGGLSTVFGGSSPEMNGSAMTAGIPQFFNGAFSNPSYNLNTLPEGYGWEAPEGSTKSYKDPWDTSFDYLGADGTYLGRGYDTYQDAIRKLSFTSGLKEYSPTAGYMNEGSGQYVESSPGGWGHSFYGTPEFSGAEGAYSPATIGQLFSSKDELYNSLMSQPGSPLTYESREKYGRPLIEGQLQNMYANYAGGNFSGAVPDWTYHRAAYDPNQPIAGTALMGDAAMVGSTPLFGPDGKILGYKSNLNPDHLRFADTSGRVTSSTYGGTTVDPEVQKILRGIDDNNAFINAGDVDKFGYRSYGSSSYNKEDSAFGGLMKKLVPMAIMAAGAYGLGSFLGGPGVAAGAGEAALGSLGSGTLGVDLAGLGTLGSTSAMAGTLGSGLSGTTLASLGLDAGALGGIGAGIGGLGLEGASGVISDIGSLVGDIAGFDPATMGYGMGDAISSVLDPSMINGLDPSAFMPDFSAINGYDMPYEALSGTDFGSPELFQPGSGTLEGISPEYTVPDSYSPLDGVDPFETTDMVNKGWNRATGYGLDNMYGKNAFGIPQGTAQEIKNMYNFMTQPMGGQRPGLFQAPSPLNTLFRGVGALDSMKQNREAMDYLKKARAGLDGNANNPNRPRGDFANQQWMNGISDPMAGYQDFMMGGGRQFIDQARAQAAKGGKRGSYINSGKMNSDLASLYMKNQIDRQNMIKGGFEGNVDNTNARAAYDSVMLPMIKNQNAPLFQMLGNTGMQYGLSELFSGW